MPNEFNLLILSNCVHVTSQAFKNENVIFRNRKKTNGKPIPILYNTSSYCFHPKAARRVPSYYVYTQVMIGSVF